MQGLHLIADVYGIGCDVALLTDCNRLQQLCMQAVETAGLTSLQAMFHGFESSVGVGNGHGRPESGGGDGGVTGVVLLAESHVAIHTWPELGAATLDVYVCNHQRDNRARAQALFDALLCMLSPQQVRIEQVWRGDLQKPEGVSVQAPLPEPLENEWLNPDTAYGLRVNACLFDEQSAYQRVRIFDTAQFGRTLKIDDHFMTSEGDEFFYHESMVHPAAITHPSPRTALVIGGGDGGSSEELLKHPAIERITLVELDEAVLRASRAHLPTVHRGSLDDSRVDIRIEEGLHYLARCADKFDLILFDLTDPAPDSQAQSLYSLSAFQSIRQHLEDGGAFVLHVGSPTFNPAGVRALLTNLRATFRIVRLYGTYIPLYGCYWCMALCSDSLDPLALDEATVARRIAERGLCNLSLYTPRMHFGLFVLPAFVEILSA